MPFPFLAGIPPLSGAVSTGAITLGAGLLTNLLNMLSPTWIIYNMTKGSGGNSIQPAIVPDSFNGIEYTNASNISNYPIEGGAFASYNKVRNPFNARVNVSVGGNDSKKKAFMDTLESMANSLDYFGLITPTGSYFNLTIERIEYRRDIKGGVGVLMVSIHFVEIMEADVSLVQGGTIGVPTDASATSSYNLGNVAGVA